METGTIAEWKKKEGDAFAPSDVLCLVETDKATVDFEATEEGYIAKILIQEGTKDVPVGTAMMITVESKDDIAAFKDYSADDSSAAPAADELESKGKSEDKPAPKKESAESSSDSKPPAKHDSKSSGSSSPGGRVFASPLARSLAKEKGYNLADISGTGPDGRIIAADVREFEPSQAAESSQGTAEQETKQTSKPAAAPGAKPAGTKSPPSVSGEAGYDDFEIGEEAKAIAAEMTKSKQTVPHYYLTVDLNLEAILSIRSQLNSALPPEEALSLNDMLLKAAALACKSVPDVNSSWMDTFVRQFHSVDINVFVNTKEGLVTPLIKDVGSRGLKAISDEIRQKTAEAGADTLSEEAKQTGTFSVVNLGMFGVKTFSPIVTPPQACVLALGKAEERVVPNDDPAAEQIYKLAQCITVTLSCDHRVVDGAVGAAWLAAYKKLVENPVTMLL